jgi:hypothetical protein
MKKILILAVIFTLLFTACIFDNPEVDDDPGGISKPTIDNNGPLTTSYTPSPIQTKKFWAQDMTKTTNPFYQIEAELLAVHNRCEVWVEKGKGVNAADARKAANEYNDKIYPKMMNAFGWQASDGKNKINTMQYVDVNEDGKLTILLLDIKDGYDGTGGYVAGYFYMADIFGDKQISQDIRSNECDMIYMDIDPTEIGDEEFYSTFAHEMQHLMNFATSVAFRSKVTNGEITDISFMDTWIDEGLSESTYWVYTGKQNLNRIGWYVYNGDGPEGEKTVSGYLDKGNNFYIWDDSGNIAVLDDYATAYLFFQWLRLQLNEDDIYWYVHLSEYPDYRAVESLTTASWSDILLNWHAANYFNNSTYGYKAKSSEPLSLIKAHYITSPSTTKELSPGEAVYSYSASARSTPFGSSYVKYQGLSGTALTNNVPAKGTLLTYNIVTSTSAGTFSGTITGETPPSTSINVPIINGRSVRHSSSFSYPIGAGDLMRSKGIEQQFNVVVPAAAVNSQPRGVKPRPVLSAPVRWTSDEE